MKYQLLITVIAQQGVSVTTASFETEQRADFAAEAIQHKSTSQHQYKVVKLYNEFEGEMTG